MAKRPREKMSMENRAKQFLPFSALSGLEEALAKKERITVPKRDLSEDMAEDLDRKLRLLTPGEMASVTYFCKGEYLQKTGLVAKIDAASRILQIAGESIPLDNILALSPASHA